MLYSLLRLASYLGWLFVGFPLTSFFFIATSGRKMLQDARRGELTPKPTQLGGELRKIRDGFGTHLRIPVGQLSLHAVAVGSRTNPLMVFIHGFPESWYSWRHQMRKFSEKYYCVAVTPRGYGESDKPNGVSEYHISKLSADIRGVIQSLGQESAIVVGHDWGGVIAWHVAMLYPEVVSRLIIMNAPHPNLYWENMSWSQLKKSYYFLLFQPPFFPEWMVGRRNYKAVSDALLGRDSGVKNREATTEEDLEIIKYDFSRDGSLHAALNYYRNLLAPTPPDLAAARKRRLRMPILVVWGMEDAALDSELNVGLEKYCDNVRYVPIPNCSHWVSQDQFNLVNDAMTDFLDRNDYVIYGDDNKE